MAVVMNQEFYLSIGGSSGLLAVKLKKFIPIETDKGFFTDLINKLIPKKYKNSIKYAQTMDQQNMMLFQLFQLSLLKKNLFLDNLQNRW